MAKVVKMTDKSAESPDWLFFCPGCNQSHGVWTTKPNIVDGKPHQWSFNGDVNKPTFHPSVHIKVQLTGQNGKESICHSFVENGMIRFLTDCKHRLAGQTVELPEY